MEQQNKFQTFDKLDDFDKKLFNYYNNKPDEIPLSTQNTIENALEVTHNHKSATITILKRVAVFILCIGIITTTTVYAKDIINFITSIFTNSTPGIDKAVDNGYAQNVEMDFIRYNEIGVKVDYVLMDEKSLDISFIYKYFKETATLKSIKISELTIKDEQNNIICFISENTISNSNIIGTNIFSSSNQQFIDNCSIRDSLLVTSQNFPSAKALYIEISKITLTLDKEITYIYGNWNFSISLEDKSVTRSSYNYSSIDTIYINKIDTFLNPTSLSIDLKLNVAFDELTLYTRNAITLKDEKNNTYRPIEMLSKNNNSSETPGSNITLLYPISIYDNINNLYLHIKLDTDKDIDVTFTK